MEVYFVCLLHVCVCLHSKTDNLLYCVRVKGLRNFKAQTDPSPDVVRKVGRYQVELYFPHGSTSPYAQSQLRALSFLHPPALCLNSLLLLCKPND